MTPSPAWQHDPADRDERAAARDDTAVVRDEHAADRDTRAHHRDTAASTRDGQFLDRVLRMHRLLTAAEARHAAQDVRRAGLAHGRTAGSEPAAGQAEIDREARSSERALDAADASDLRAGLDWMRDSYLSDTRSDRAAAADDRARSLSDRAAAARDRDAADADRQQSAVDDAQYG